jgi:phospholipid transport system substrate-binding protein
MNRRHFLSLTALFVCANRGLAIACPEGSATVTPTFPAARAFIQSMHKDLQTAIKASKDPKRDPWLLEIFDRTLDYDYLTTETLGRYATDLTSEQRREFDATLKALVRSSYRRNLRDPSGYEVIYDGETSAAKSTLVRTTTSNKRNKREEDLSVDYLVGKCGATYLVQDVVTSGVSLVRNYRSQFGRIIKRKGFAALIKMMIARLAELQGS